MGDPQRGRPPNQKQRQHVLKLRQQGLLFRQIGAQLGITRQRAHQIYARMVRPEDDPTRKPRLTVEAILQWADAFHAREGRWPRWDSGSVAESPDDTWKRIDRGLRYGFRGLPGGSNLDKLLRQRRMAKRPRKRKRP